MMMKRYFILAVITAAMACKKPIVLAPVARVNSYLVVDGNISSGDSSLITLSRTVNIDDTARSNPELNARITIEGSGGGSYPLVAAGKGDYKSAILSLSAEQKYRLKIVTADSKQYASDFVPVKNSPAIDNVQYEIKDNGLAVTVDTHDAANATHYYRWDYTDTYMVESIYNSKYIVVNGDTSALRPPEQQIFHCWLTDTSANILLGSSAKLTEDRISKQQVAFLGPNAESLRIKFSILVKQHALTTEAFNYFDLLKRNSEQVGGVFDAQPSELTGNVRCLSDANELVIGYVTAGAVAQKRLFIDNSELPATWKPDLSYYDGCALITELYDYVPDLAPPGYVEHQVREYVYNGIETLVDRILSPQPGVSSAKPYCADCTIRGTNKQPTFWK